MYWLVLAKLILHKLGDIISIMWHSIFWPMLLFAIYIAKFNADYISCFYLLIGITCFLLSSIGWHCCCWIATLVNGLGCLLHSLMGSQSVTNSFPHQYVHCHEWDIGTTNSIDLDGQAGIETCVDNVLLDGRRWSGLASFWHSSHRSYSTLGQALVGIAQQNPEEEQLLMKASPQNGVKCGQEGLLNSHLCLPWLPCLHCLWVGWPRF